MQKLELTLAIIKPHAIKNPVALSYIRNVLKDKFVVVKTKRVSLDTITASKFYDEHVGKFFYNRLVTFMASGSIDLHVIAHSNAIQLWRRILGPTSVYKGQFKEPHCLRGMFGISDTRNVAHGSADTIENVLFAVTGDRCGVQCVKNGLFKVHDDKIHQHQLREKSNFSSQISHFTNGIRIMKSYIERDPSFSITICSSMFGDCNITMQ